MEVCVFSKAFCLSSLYFFHFGLFNLKLCFRIACKCMYILLIQQKITSPTTSSLTVTLLRLHSGYLKHIRIDILTRFFINPPFNLTSDAWTPRTWRAVCTKCICLFTVVLWPTITNNSFFIPLSFKVIKYILTKFFPLMPCNLIHLIYYQ